MHTLSIWELFLKKSGYFLGQTLLKGKQVAEFF